MVIFTSSSKLASLSLKSVALDASTVKIFWFPATFENVSPLDNRVTSRGAGGGAFSLSRCAIHLRSRYTPAVTVARSNAASADQRAYFAASLLFMTSVKQNFRGLYRRRNAWQRVSLPSGCWPGSEVHDCGALRASRFAPSSRRPRPGSREALVRGALSSFLSGNRRVVGAAAAGEVALGGACSPTLKNSRVNALSVAALAGLDDGVGMPHCAVGPLAEERSYPADSAVVAVSGKIPML